MKIDLSKRLLMLARMVTPGNKVADVGCDHGFLDIYLVQQGVCPRALAMDVREGPLANAREHVRESGLGDYIEIRMSDGLRACRAGEAETLVCAGMGGRLMEKILREGMDRAAEMRELILQPQSELPEFRAFLRKAGFRIVCEDAVCEDGKYYFAVKAVCGNPAGREGFSPGGDDESLLRLYDLFGEGLLTQRHPVLLQYLRQRASYLGELEASMGAAGTERARARLKEIRQESEDIGRALLFFGREGCS